MGGCATVEEARVLRLRPSVGATQTIAVAAQLRERRTIAGVERETPPLRLQVTFDAKVNHVEPPSGIRYDVDFLELALLGDSKTITAQLVEQLADHMGWADRVRGAGSVSERGSLLAFQLDVPDAPDDDEVTATLKRSAARVMDSVAEALALTGIPFPDGAVPKGATWSGQGTVTARGVPCARELRYELIDADDKSARIKVRATLRGPGLDGSFEGDLKYDLGLPLPVAGQLVYQLEWRTQENGQEVSVKLDSDLQLGVPQ
ncbi:MAG TPA: hypothetical protein VFF06_33805 [Polyangia bacterium]|nr:hypothetical protein [Polyangia bacterium]